MSDDHIEVICRVRPLNDRENGWKTCLNASKLSNTVTVQVKPAEKSFTFDLVADDRTSQEEIFQMVGLPVTQKCLQGYNGTILCYGQTGTGKSHTVFGASSPENALHPDRGLVPRVLEYLWGHISTVEAESNGAITFSCRCSFYEIYQERVYDLLDMNGASGGLQVREDSKSGVFVDGIIEESVSSPSDAGRVLSKGYLNRHVGETTMNRESSRSHAVFQLTLQSTEDNNGVRTCRTARFSLVDLAGSERQKDTNATGERLKEASQINKSLSALGNVINALSAASNVTSNGLRPARHVHYRDSKLTFLLRDSIGGNSKTALVATVSPCENCIAETLSTLKFAQRAKTIRNNVALNEESTGSVLALQKEIETLRARLRAAESGTMAVSVSGSTTSENSDEGFNKIKRISGNGILPFSPLKEGARRTSLDLHLQSDALERCKAADELRQRAEWKSEALNKRLDQAEKNLLGMNMKLKMRDSEIKRLKAGPAGASSAEADKERDEMVKTEVNAVREEMQCELLKYRMQSEEYARRLRVLYAAVHCKENVPDDSNIDEAPQVSEADVAKSVAATKAINLWDEQNESHFQHALLERVTEAEDKQTRLMRKVEAMASSRFLEEFGFTLEEARTLQASCVEAVRRAEAAEESTGEMRIGLLRSQQRVSELQTKCGEYESQLKEAEALATERQEAIERMRKEIAQREEEVISALASEKKGLQEAEFAMREQLRAKEAEGREAFNKAMKDNTTLLKTCRELESQLAAKAAELETLQVTHTMTVSKMQKEHEHQAALAAARAEDLDRSVAELKASVEALTETNLETSESLRCVQGEVVEAQREIERLTFERDSAKEDADNLFTQAETLKEDIASITKNFEDVKASSERKSEQIEAMSAEIDRLSSECRKLAEENLKLQTAEKHLRKSNEMAIGALTQTQKQLEEAQAASVATEKQLCDAQADISSKLKQLEETQAALNAAQRQIDEAKSALSAMRTQVEETHSAVDAAQAQIADLTLQKQNLEQQLATSQEAEADLRDQLQQSQASEASLRSKIAASTEKVEALSAEMLKIANDIEEAKEIEISLRQQLTDAEAKIDALSAAKDSMSKNLAAAEAELTARQEQIDGLSTECDGLSNQLASAQNQVSNAATENQKLIESRDLLVQELRSAEEKVADAVLEKERVADQLSVEMAVTVALRHDVAVLEEKVDTLCREKSEIAELLAAESAKLIAAANNQTASCHALTDLTKAHESLREEMMAATQKLEAMSELRALLNEQLAAETEKVAQAESQLAENVVVISAINEKLVFSEAAQAKLVEQLDVAEKKLDGLLCEKNELTAQLVAATAQRETDAAAVADLLVRLDNAMKEKESVAQAAAAAEAAAQAAAQAAAAKPSFIQADSVLASLDALDEELAAEEQQKKPSESNPSAAASATVTTAPAVPKDMPEIWPTKMKKLDSVSRLVWAPCPWIKSARPMFPARVCDNSEGVCEDIPWPIPKGSILVEFFNLPKIKGATSKFVVLEKASVKSFNASFDDGSQAVSGAGSKKQENQWDSSHLKNMREIIRKKYNPAVADALYDGIKRTANEFLRLALGGEEAAVAPVDTAELAAAEGSTDGEQNLVLLQRQLQELQERCHTQENHIKDLQAEIARQAGHSNNKQKIQLHQQLKKDIQEQTALVSQLRDELVEITLQRDAAKAELAKVKSHQKETALATGTSTRTRSAALRDVNVAAAGENSHAQVLDL